MLEFLTQSYFLNPIFSNLTLKIFNNSNYQFCLIKLSNFDIPKSFWRVICSFLYLLLAATFSDVLLYFSVMNIGVFYFLLNLTFNLYIMHHDLKVVCYYAKIYENISNYFIKIMLKANVILSKNVHV